MRVPSKCVLCKYVNGKSGFSKCEAFPKGIPDKIFLGEIEHTTPYPGDNGIQFEEREKNSFSPNT
jgi:hypothetical protein